MEYIDALCADAFDASSILSKLWELLLSWPELDLPPCWQDFMSWLRKLSPGSADWLVDAFALEAA